jgi:hypothetical protein
VIGGKMHSKDETDRGHILVNRQGVDQGWANLVEIKLLNSGKYFLGWRLLPDCTNIHMFEARHGW